MYNFGIKIFTHLDICIILCIKYPYRNVNKNVYLTSNFYKRKNP